MDTPPASGLRLRASFGFVDDLVARGTFVMGGPLADNSGSAGLLEGVSVEEARELLLRDPFVANGVFELDEILEWTIFVDELSGG